MFFDNRRNDRFEFSDHIVEYTFGYFANDEIFEADLINAGEMGLCMLSPHCLTVGQEITLRNFMGFSTRTAVVIWTAEDEETDGLEESDQVLFKVGLKFLE